MPSTEGDLPVNIQALEGDFGDIEIEAMNVVVEKLT